MELIQSVFKGDKVIWMIFLFLCIISLVEVFSAIGTLAYARMNPFEPIIRHGLYLLIGVALVVASHNFHYKYTALLVFPLLLLSVIMLILTPIIGVRLNEAARWIEIFGIQIQPSELAKLSMVLFSAWFLGRAQGSKEAMDKAFWVVLIVTAALAFLIVFENLSTAILLCLFVFLMMVVAGVDWKKLLILFLLVASAAALLLFLLIKIERLDGVPRWETWHNRLVTEQLDVRDEGFKITDENRQVSHAKIAISGGKFLGVLPGNSSQRDFLPQAYSDFIFAIIIEDLGWLGLFGVPFLYLFLLFRALKIAKRCTKSVPMLLVLGSALIISMQAFVNMAVAVNWFPVTGQPLPLISRGGSSGVITCLYFAIILSVSNFATQKPIPEEENLISNETEDPDYEQQEEIEAAD